MTEPNFEVQPLGLGKLLTEGSRFMVPPHQRDYSWTEDEIEQLFNDVQEARTSKQDSYFLGLMVFIPGDRGEFTILDGQQRMATATIILSSIRNWLRRYNKFDPDAEKIQNEYIALRELGEKELQPRLMLNEMNNPTFRMYIVDDIPTEDIKKALANLKRHDPNRRLLEAMLYCRKQIDDITTKGVDTTASARELFEIVKYLRDNVRVVRLSVPTEADAYTVFETLNDRGLDLTVLDLLKNYLFGKASGSDTDFREIKNRWTQMMATLANVRGDDFLKAYWTSRHGRIQTAQLFQSVKKQYPTSESVYAMSNDMLTASEQYAALELADDPVWASFSVKAREHVRALKLLGSRQVHPILLSALAKFSTNEIERLLWLLEVLIVRYQLIGGGRTGKLEIACAKLAADIFQDKVCTATQAFQALLDIYPNDDDFKSSFQTKQERNNAKSRYLLSKLELQARQKEKPDMTSSESEPSKTLTIEHVLPKNPGDEWKQILQEDPTSVEDCTFRLGNFCLLTKVNKDLGRKSYEAKKEVFTKSTLLLTKEAADYSSWTRETIEKRQEKMAQLAVSAWRFQ